MPPDASALRLQLDADTQQILASYQPQAETAAPTRGQLQQALAAQQLAEAKLDEAAIDAIRARYVAPLRRAGIAAGATVVDWLPRWDARLLGLLRQAMPGTRLIVVERDPRDALLNWLAFGWLPGIGCSDVAAAARWFARAQRHLHHGAGLDDPRRLHVDADAVLADPATGGAGLSAFLGLGGLLRRGPELAQADQWPGGLPSRFPAGHWRHYASVLAEPFAQVAGGDGAA